MLFMYIKRLIFSCELENLLPPILFLSMCLSDIIAFTNSNGENESPWMIHHWIFNSVKLFPPVIRSPFQFFITKVMHFMTLFNILYIL